jgi:hypothetical protein
VSVSISTESSRARLSRAVDERHRKLEKVSTLIADKFGHGSCVVPPCSEE